MGKLEPLYTVSGNVKWYSHNGKQTFTSDANKPTVYVITKRKEKETLTGSGLIL